MQIANTATPSRNMRRRPNMSPSRPADQDQRSQCQAVRLHHPLHTTTLAPKLFCNAGRATLTTVLSMNAMLEATIVATRIHAP